MSTTTLRPLSALAGILSGLTVIICTLLINLLDPRLGEPFDFLSSLFALSLTVGVYLRQRRESGVFGGLAFFMLFFGLSLIVSLAHFGAFMFHELPEELVDRMMDGPSGPVFIGSILIFVVGELLFGISVLRAGIFSRIAAVLFMVATIPTGLHLADTFSESVAVISSITAGVALIWWSVELHRLVSNEAEPVFKPALRLVVPGSAAKLDEVLR